jgi:tetratricopeptide (TPR) repeat protein
VLKIPNFVSFILTLIFSVHPLFASAVSWVPSRGDLLIALFGLWIFISFHKHIITGKPVYFILNAVLFALAIFSKETAILFPLLLLFYYFFVLNQPLRIKRLIPYFIVWATALVAYYILRSHVIKNNLNENVIGINTLLDNLSVIPITISKFFIPYNLSTYPLFDGMATITGILLLALLLYITVKYTTKQNTLLLMGIIWFFVFTLPGLIVRLPHAEARYLYLEHRTYLIMIGIIILLSSFCNILLSNKIISFKKFTGIAIGVLALFSIIAWAHSDDYKDQMAFLNRAISFNNPDAYIVRGNISLLAHDSISAADDFDKAIELSPDYPDAYFYRGKFEGAALQSVAAEKDFTKAINLDSTYTEAWIKRSILRSNLQDYNDAMNDLNKAVQLDSNDAEIYFRFGDLFFHQNKYNEAYTNLTKAIKLEPRYADAYMNRGSLHYTMNDLPGAIDDYRKAIAIRPGFLTYYNLAVVYNDLHQPDMAIPLFDSSINFLPNFTPAYLGKGKALQQQGNMAEACKNWQQALTLGDITAKDTLGKYCK